jgi:cell division control protein 6
MVDIFHNQFALSQRYIPEKLIARDLQIENISRLVRPLLSRGDPKNAMVFGKTGTGKTVVVRYVLNNLAKMAERKKLNIVPVFINCADINAPRRIILQILTTVSPKTPFKKGLSISEYYLKLWEIINKKQVSLIIVFDEIDYLKDQNILYTLSRAGENQYINFERSIGIIGLSNNLLFAEQIDARVASSLGRRDFVFPPYDSTQLIQILEDRARIAFTSNVLDADVIPFCAALSAQEHGDARKALVLLENAGEVAEHAGAEKVTESHVREGYEMANMDCIAETIRTLPLHSKIVLYSIVEVSRTVSTPTTGDVDAQYRKLCEQASIHALGRTSISKLISDLMMQGFIDTAAQYRGRYGRTRKISLLMEQKKIETVLFSDPIFCKHEVVP